VIHLHLRTFEKFGENRWGVRWKLHLGEMAEAAASKEAEVAELG
jgi:hypothetical protein